VRSGTEVVFSVLPFTEVVPKNVARVEVDRSEQPQIGIPSQLLKRGESAGRKPLLLSLRRSLSRRLHCPAVVKPHQQGILQGGILQGGILQGGDSGQSSNQLQLLRTKTLWMHFSRIINSFHAYSSSSSSS